MRICLVEDMAAAGLEPLTLTRPVYELFLGGRTLLAKVLAAAPREAGAVVGELGAMVGNHLAAVQQERYPDWAINNRAWLLRDRVLVINSRWVPPTHTSALPWPHLCGSDAGSGTDRGSWVGMCAGEPACAFVDPGRAGELDPHNVDAWFEHQAGELPRVELPGEWVRYPWDFVARNSHHLIQDFETLRSLQPDRLPYEAHHEHVAVVGPRDRLSIHPSVRIDPYVVLDTTNGPIVIEEGVCIQPFTRVEGPCHLGARTQLFRANLRGGVAIGPNCRIGGEVEESIVLGHSNKYHEGFLGHAYIGEWVNLGAITSNSDLRNDYGEVHVPQGGDPVATGSLKVGCFIGDHTRTGLGSMINTGTSVGVMCNLLPAGPLLPKHVPSFTAILYGRVAPGFPIDQMFRTARTVKGRRGQTFTDMEEQLYLNLYERTRLERERAFQRHAERKGDHWPAGAAAR